MGFKRMWDSTCPLVWNKWEADGITWTIQDLPPEDDERAIQLLLEQFCPDERLCSLLEIHKDPTSLQQMADFWRQSISQRMSLACYKTVDNNKTLAALNVCIVKCIDDEEPKTEGMETGKLFELLKTMKYLDSKYDAFENLGVDKFLYGLGLLVTRENRGFKLGAKVLAARVQRRHIARCAGLARLPLKYVPAGYKYVMSRSPKSQSVQEFNKYLNRYWFNDVAFIKTWSCYGEEIRNTNNLEGWHARLNRLVGRQHPSFAKVLDILSKETRNMINKKKLTSNNYQEIADTIDQLKNGSITVGHCLEIIAPFKY